MEKVDIRVVAAFNDFSRSRLSLARGKTECQRLEDSLEIMQVVCSQTCLVHEILKAERTGLF